LLISAKRNHERWIVPGGGVEPTEDTCIAALREVKEEAGAKGTLGRCLGVFEVGTFHIYFYCFNYLSIAFTTCARSINMHC